MVNNKTMTDDDYQPHLAFANGSVMMMVIGLLYIISDMLR